MSRCAQICNCTFRDSEQVNNFINFSIIDVGIRTPVGEEGGGCLSIIAGVTNGQCKIIQDCTRVTSKPKRCGFSAVF